MERRSFGDAIVIGGSMAGLLAARVLSDYFRSVTIVERDEPGTPSQARRGVPQGHHAHGLLLRGQDTICRLFGSMREQLLAAGARSVNMGRDVKWYHFDVWKCRYHSALDFISASRPLIEWTVAERVRRLPNVKTMHGWSVESVIYDGHSISGIRMHRRDDRDVEQRLNADLVIDASGRGSQIPQQLRVLGFERPEESSVRIDVGYASCLFRAPKTARDWKALYVVSQPPAKRGALILPLEGDRWICTLVGMHGDHPPTDYAGYMAFAKSLPVPDMYEALRSAEAAGRDRALWISRRTASPLREAQPVPAGPAGARRCAVQLQSDLRPGHERGRDVRRRAAIVSAGAGRDRLGSAGSVANVLPQSCACRRPAVAARDG